MTPRNTIYDASTSSGREHIALAASGSADQIFMQDWGTEEFIKDDDVMQAVSTREFDECLKKNSSTGYSL